MLGFSAVSEAPISVLLTAATIFYPGSDVSVAGWITSSGGAVAADVGEHVLNTSTFASSPDLVTPARLAWDNPIPAGSWTVDIDGEYIGTSGQARLVFLDTSGATVGTTPWQVLTSTGTSYTLAVTTTDTSTEFRYEVQA